MNTGRVRFPGLAVLAAGLALSETAATTSGQHALASEPFEEGEIFLELNNTDGDLGIHTSVDGGPWTRLEIEGPDGSTLLNILTAGRLRQQGLTQLFIESAEPSFDELNPGAFFRRFPEGRYLIKGKTSDGSTLRTAATLSHVLAAPAENVLVSGMPAAESCDENALPRVTPPVLIEWDPVTTSHPSLGRPGPVEIDRYQVFVERKGVNLGIDLPPAITEFEIPVAVTATGREFKFEIIARTTAGNNTAIESCFRVR